MKIRIIKESLDTKELFKAKKEIEGLLAQGELASAMHFAEVLEVPIDEISWFRHTFDLINTRSEFLKYKDELVEFARWIDSQIAEKPKFGIVPSDYWYDRELDWFKNGKPLIHWVEKYEKIMNSEGNEYHMEEKYFQQALTFTLESLSL